VGVRLATNLHKGKWVTPFPFAYFFLFEQTHYRSKKGLSAFPPIVSQSQEDRPAETPLHEMKTHFQSAAKSRISIHSSAFPINLTTIALCAAEVLLSGRSFDTKAPLSYTVLDKRNSYHSRKDDVIEMVCLHP
jgi:hypothetical protein